MTNQRDFVKFSMISAAGLWLAATFLYSQAATGNFGIGTPKRDGMEITNEQAVSAAKGVVALVQSERDVVRWKNKQANSVAFLAASASILTIGLIWLTDPATEVRATLTLTREGVSSIWADCRSQTGQKIEATVDLDDLTKKYVTLTDVEKKHCRNFSNLTIPSNWLTYVAVQP
ncbi:hypothetical protein ACIBCP_30760 [Streptomyces sp. NPDC051287]|uniref:hypothetical protein n=1 Tax=Streptomyces sp. NPDC051287 TaxID=3365648 RepID=UPI00378FFBCB